MPLWLPALLGAAVLWVVGLAVLALVLRGDG
jgi:hypothetical protein